MIASSDQGDIGSPDAGGSILREYGQSLADWQEWDQSFEQLVECRGKRRLRNISVRSAKVPDSLRVSL